MSKEQSSVEKPSKLTSEQVEERDKTIHLLIRQLRLNTASGKYQFRQIVTFVAAITCTLQYRDIIYCNGFFE